MFGGQRAGRAAAQWWKAAACRERNPGQSFVKAKVKLNRAAKMHVGISAIFAARSLTSMNRLDYANSYARPQLLRGINFNLQPKELIE